MSNETELQLRQGELRKQHAGSWVGWSPDCRDIVVSGVTLEIAFKMGGSGLIYEWLEPLDRPKTKACPRCGRLVLRSCYHDGDDVSSVDMSSGQARRLRLRRCSDLLAEIDNLLKEGDLHDGGVTTLENLINIVDQHC